jgi:hypothetical protein
MGIWIFRALAENGRSYRRTDLIVHFYELGVARLRNHWQGRGESGEEFLPGEHLYASDLDLFGSGSMFELLCTARTGIGKATLAKWLLNSAEPDEIAERQIAIAELRDQLELQERWASAGRVAAEHISASILRDWSDAYAISFPRFVQVFTILLPICLATSVILGLAGMLGAIWLWAVGAIVGLEALVAALMLKKTRMVSGNVTLPAFELSLLSPLLRLLGEQCFESPLLKSLQVALSRSTAWPSQHIGRLIWAVRVLELRRSEYFAAACALFLWGTNLSMVVEHWRQRHRQALNSWLESIGQFEALLCLARYAYENPDYSFPGIKVRPQPLFLATALGHPLLDRRDCVRCDLRLDAAATKLIMVSGSNMSGKSTLLRSIGLNAVLALAGGPVCATQLQISSLRVGCSISVQDSLMHGKSKFQAEVERLRKVLAMAPDGKLLFLLDEMLGGTNSSDRLAGARAITERLISADAIGLVTTHDLALTRVVSELDGRAVNSHFEEHYIDGEMRFDYQMRPGILAGTNGLSVMSALGLLSLAESEDAASPDRNSAP